MAELDTAKGDGPSTVQAPPLGTRIKYASIAFMIQNFIVAPVLFMRAIKDYVAPAEIRADLVKKYPCRSHLPIRIFFPKSYDRNSGQKLPTMFTIHGGGFVLGTPEDTDRWNYLFASKHNMLVVALNYAKAPSNPFPGPVHDIEELLCSAMADSSLPIDPDRVALAGWSAGGNLTLAAAQLETVRSRIKAAVPLYPVLDFSTTHEVKTHLRRYKPELGGFRANEKDLLLRLAAVFDWAYLPTGQSTKDPLLSPVYVASEALPDNIFVVGCELDLLSHEAWRLASRLASRPVPSMDEPVGRKEAAEKGELILDDERFHFEETSDGKRYRWLLVPDTIHGFDQGIERLVRGDTTLLEDARVKTDKTISIIGDWLLSGPLKP
ncbi:alpha/beta-hydrolase [Thozetella sp. PMI_491]|nr:alpha/beta-hydrolase [Thozetella sp. PMI_491]